MSYLKTYEMLLHKAATDYKSAKLLHSSNDEEIDIEVVLFHLQQALEKYLKAILSYNDTHFSKTHDLKMLLDMNKEKIILNDEEIELLLELNQYAVNGRYHSISEFVENIDDYFDITGKIRQKAFEIVKQIKVT